MLKSKQVNSIVYTNNKGETKQKDVLVFNEPQKDILAVEVTNMPHSEVIEMINLMEGYKEYLELMKSKQFTFEDFIEHTTNEQKAVAWKKLQLERISKQ